MKSPIAPVILLLLLFSCKSTRQSVGTRPSSAVITVNGKLWAAAFQQRAAEYKALCYQAFNIASFRLDQELHELPSGNPPAIISDIDETFLDNSPYAVHQSVRGKDYEPATWAEWTAKADADTLAGAVNFFNFAASRGVEVFYVTNRKQSEREATLSNLRKFNFPFADDKHLILRMDSSSMETRRVAIAQQFNVLLFLGDNLADFSKDFDGKSETVRNANVASAAAEFGKRFIILPNPSYGGWEEALFDNRSTALILKDSILASKLKGY